MRREEPGTDAELEAFDDFPVEDPLQAAPLPHRAPSVAAKAPSREPEPLLVDARRLAALLGVSLRHVRRLEVSGLIGPRPIRLGRSARYFLDGPSGIRAWLAAGAPSRRDWERRAGS